MPIMPCKCYTLGLWATLLLKKKMLLMWNPAVAQAAATRWKGDILDDTLQQVRLWGSRQGSMIPMSTPLTNKPAKHRWHSKFTAVVKSSSSPHFSSANNFFVFQEGRGGVPGYNETHLMRPKCDTAATSSLCKGKGPAICFALAAYVDWLACHSKGRFEVK